MSISGCNAPPVLAIPPCFQLTELGTYQDLSKKVFSGQEKIFLCQQMRGKTDLLLSPTHFGGKTPLTIKPSAIAKRYKLSLENLKKWLRNYGAGQQLHDKLGRPPIADPAFIENFKADVILMEQDKKLRNDPVAVRKALNDRYHESLIQQGRVHNGAYLLSKKRVRTNNPEDEQDTATTTITVTKTLNDVTISEPVVRKIMKRAAVTKRKGQILTPARVNALLDIRLVYKIACAWKAFAGYNSAESKWNFDCTTVIVSQPMSTNLRCVVRERGQEDPKVEATNGDGGLNRYLLWGVLEERSAHCER
eukprot:gene7038-7782_t